MHTVLSGPASIEGTGVKLTCIVSEVSGHSGLPTLFIMIETEPFSLSSFVMLYLGEIMVLDGEKVPLPVVDHWIPSLSLYDPRLKRKFVSAPQIS